MPPRDTASAERNLFRDRDGASRVEEPQRKQAKEGRNIMPRVVHFEIPAEDTKRAAKFYNDVFGWNVNKWEGPQEYWLITTGPDDQPGINGGLMARQAPGASTVNTVDVPSVDEYIARVQKSGGEVVVPKMAIPGIGWHAYCNDTEGNLFGIMESDESAQ
jgi:predicted enzyme related to lactoylglutathione lyase